MIRGCICGRSLYGKTTLAKELSLHYKKKHGLTSYVYDPWVTNWGRHAWVVNDKNYFWETVWKQRGGLVVVDDGSLGIARDGDLIPVFTMLRHNQHRLLVIAHNASDLLPSMRQEIDTLYLFRQSRSSAKMWYEDFAETEILKAPRLPKYKFVLCDPNGAKITYLTR